MQDNRQPIITNDEHPQTALARETFHTRIEHVKKQALYKTVVLIAALATIALMVKTFIYPQLSEQGVIYFQMAEVGIFGYLTIRLFSELATKLLNIHHPETQARSARSIIRIGGMLIILAVIVIMLARDPYITLTVTTITGIALAISVQSVIGNAIAGMVLAIVRPFKIGQMITVFGITGTVRDIGLLYVRLTTSREKKTVLVPNGTMLGTAIIKENT